MAPALARLPLATLAELLPGSTHIKALFSISEIS